MNKLIILIYLLPSLAWSYDNSSMAHVNVSIVSSAISCAAFKDKSKELGAIAGLGVAMGLGHLKESSDEFYDLEDMAFNFLGATIGTGLCLSF